MNIISEVAIRRGLVLTLKIRIYIYIFFCFSRLSAPTYFHSSLHSPFRSDIKEDNDQASEIDGKDEQASGISAKSKLFTVNENKRETAL